MSSSWITNWMLLEFFLVLVTAMAVYRMIRGRGIESQVRVHRLLDQVRDANDFQNQPCEKISQGWFSVVNDGGEVVAQKPGY